MKKGVKAAHQGCLLGLQAKEGRREKEEEVEKKDFKTVLKISIMLSPQHACYKSY